MGTFPIVRVFLPVLLVVSWPALIYAAEIESVPLTTGVAEELLKEETVSIAARHEQPISEAPSNVYVITDEDIRQSGATDLPTVLRRIPGIEVIQTTGADFDVSARGDNQLLANKMLVMVDGRSIYLDVQGLVYWKGIPVTLPEIKRIEVLKGPASALYGFNAFDGVINIITKSPEEMKGTTLQFGGGEFGTISSAAVQAGTMGKFGYRLSAGHDQNQQWRNRDTLALRSNKFNVQTNYGLSADSTLSVSGGLVDMNRFDGPLSETTIPSARLSQGYANVSYERPNFFIRSWWNGYDDTSIEVTQAPLANFVKVIQRDGTAKFHTHSDTYNLEGQHAVELVTGNLLTYGVNYRNNNLSSDFIGAFKHDENRLGVYLQDEWKATRELNLVTGVRYDLDTLITPTVSPRFALLYNPVPEHTFRASMSIAYRPPTLTDRFLDVQAITTLPLPPPFNTTTTLVRQNAGLKPEKILSYELNYQGWFFRHRMRVGGSIFFNHLTNLINSRPTSPGMAGDVNDSGQADIYGGEASLDLLAARWLSGFANFSYEEIGQSFTDTTRRGAPRFKANAGMRAEWDNGISGEAAIYHVGAATYSIANSFSVFEAFGAPPINPRVGSYNLLNLRAGYRFWHEKAEVAVSVFNALDDRHKEHPLGDTIGSRVMGWLTLRW